MKILQSIYDAWNGQLESRVQAFKDKLAMHAFTTNIPAPVEHELVEYLARGGTLEIEPDPVDEAGPPVTPPKSTLEFLEMFSLDERKAVRRLARENEDVEDYLSLLAASGFVTKDDPRTVGGINVMVALGALSRVRADEILAQI